DASCACAGDAMTAPIKTVSCSTSLYDATCVMEAEKIRRLVVVDADGKLAGVAALADLALAGKDEATAQVVKEVSEPKS
ncbi:MAG: CBS domain-containing protein, partial [Pseudomonadota bacterium]|nr:CBS domain-containing protein [Pseudomonadota bacterium]